MSKKGSNPPPPEGVDIPKPPPPPPPRKLCDCNRNITENGKCFACKLLTKLFS